jgi:hypothetical protein
MQKNAQPAKSPRTRGYRKSSAAITASFDNVLQRVRWNRIAAIEQE